MSDKLLLAIDAGNTNTVFGIYQGEQQRGQWRAETRAGRTADEYAVWLNQLLGQAGIEPDQINAAIIASVVPETIYHLRSLCQANFDCEPLIVGENVDIGVELAVDNPREVGADRVVNAVAAHSRYPGALIVIDFGTATTFDVIDASGAYRGGAIAPGINLSLEALHRAAAQLPRVAAKKPQAVIGTATTPMMQSGVYWGYVGLIEGLVQRIKNEFGEPMTVIATGGLAPLFHVATEAIEQIDADLTMRGLLEIYRRNHKDST
ncbi:MAG: type III pantothenate kinase [Alphaproteobacteria bacterium]|jgi:type III pantothenate kinase